MTVPEPPFDHLLRLSDDTGVLEHARGAVPRRQHGYCTDDVARALVVICREPSPAAALTALGERCLAFLGHAQTSDGASHNRLSYDRRWSDEAGLGDWWGRSLWGAGTAAARGRSARFRADALAHFEVGAATRSPAPRAMAFAALGAAEVLTVRSDHGAARDLLKSAADALSGTRPDEAWPWPEPRLAYANARWAEALMAAGWALEDDGLVDDGLRLLGWLLDLETSGDRLSLTPVGGWGPGEPRPGFDQQPIEAAALADACARAFLLTGEDRFVAGVSRAVAWFKGDNDTQVPMYDPQTGGGYDGLERDGRNDNQGAESTIALISTLQQGIRLIGGQL
ncbi:MAG TPA: glycosyltransferase [Acidimicrobiia bacterium]|nr:glycosyltransferase [Acidimicrobiia bacterium]